MEKKKIIRIVYFILIVIWALLIFYMSHQQGESSSSLSRTITAIFFKSEEMINLVEPYVRKLAHLSEYAVGGILFMGLFLTYEWSEKKQMLISIALGIWYAIFDEIHQLLVPGRSGRVIDVVIDSLGICLGVVVTMIIYKLITKNKKEGILNDKF